MRWHAVVILTTVCLAGCATHSGGPTTSVKYSGEEGSLQQVIDTALPGTTVVCDTKKQLEITAPLTIKKAITLKGLNARLPKKLGRTSLIVVEARGVTLINITLHGNYDSVDQKDRAPLISIRKGNFRVEDCKFYDSSKDGVEVCPENRGDDIVGGTIRNIEAFRIGRDAVSISGGNQGLRVRDVTVANISLKKGYLRGAVEVSDGTDNIRVRGVYAEACRYAIDVQDHRRQSAPNTNIGIEDVTAVNCGHIIRTDNSPRGHATLTLRNFTAMSCTEPVRISNTKDVTIDGLKIVKHQSSQSPPISLKNCQGVSLRNVTIETAHFINQPVRTKGCTDVRIKELKKTKLTVTN
jgi:hypothetical protein